MWTNWKRIRLVDLTNKELEMDIQIERIDNITVVHLKGSFDRSARGKMEIELLALVSYGSSAVA